MLYLRGFVPLSTVDYPDQLAAVVFLQGCECRCPYCYNLECLDAPVEGQSMKHYYATEEKFINYIQKYSHLLDGVVISGGDPLTPGIRTTEDMLRLIQRLKQYKLKVKLDTTGFIPVDPTLCKLIDYFAFDFKAPYKWQGFNLEGEYGWRRNVMRAVTSSTAQYEFRTTIHKALLSRQDLFEMCGYIQRILYDIGESVSKENRMRGWFLQQFLAADCVDKELIKKETYTDEELCTFAGELRTTYPINVRCRNANVE